MQRRSLPLEDELVLAVEGDENHAAEPRRLLDPDHRVEPCRVQRPEPGMGPTAEPRPEEATDEPRTATLIIRRG